MSRTIGSTLLLRLMIGGTFGAAIALPLTACSSGQASDAPAGYAVVRTVNSGKALSRRMPQARTVRDALRLTLVDLERYFGSKPQLRGAYEDTRDHLSGGAGNALVAARRSGAAPSGGYQSHSCPRQVLAV